VQIVQKNQRIKENDAYKQNKEERAGDKKISIKKHKVHLVFDSGACVIRMGEQLKRRIKSTNVVGRNIWNRFIYFLEPIPENFGYSLGGYSHREHYRAPDRKKSTKGRRGVKDGDKEQVDGHEV
jgi:hypothetical protein